MKYEMIFGDEALFDGAPDDVDMIGYNGGFYKNSQNGPMYCYGCTFTTDEYRNKGFIAMRRIIAEPKRWTWEDNKAGRLPDVGCLVVNKTGKVSEVVTIKNGYFVLFECGKNNGPLTIHGDLLMNQFKPVETPEEKSQREEDEFVVAMLDAASQEQLMSAGFKSGVIAAYRKLKGGEL